MPRRHQKRPGSSWELEVWVVIAIVLALWILGIAGAAFQRLLVGSRRVPQAAPVTVVDRDPSSSLGGISERGAFRRGGAYGQNERA